ncbi:MAG TPA: hypothetical protein VK993_12275 [Chthoniobacterales bacterium]|nr:hypothetical protein [Chthoniobacterales bacterium]
MSDIPLKAYGILQKSFWADIPGDENRRNIAEVYRGSLEFLSKCGREALRSLIPGKEYFAFRAGSKLSRAVNARQFGSTLRQWQAFDAALTKRELDRFTPDQLTQIIYTLAMSFCCYVDLTKERDQKTPGTFLEYLVSHLFARRLGVVPTTRIQVLNLDMDTTLPTDFIFNLGKDRPKFHLPIKASTRERVIQVWAHQRVLDGVFGTGRFLGTPVILAETKTDTAKREVIEICLPAQWRIYQMHIAQLKRIYYLDVPATYEKLNDVFPPIAVKSFGHFFFEADTLSA